jgi:hypothetical protein
MSLAVIPLAITMNAGPQIMSAIIFVTAPKALKLSGTPSLSHRSGWKGDSTNFAQTEFSEVRMAPVLC